MTSFSEAKENFDKSIGLGGTLPQSLVTVNGKMVTGIQLKSKDGEELEEYYKWQFIYALLNSGLYSKDYMGVEIRFPKGNKSSAPLRLDGAIFDSPEWIQHYEKYWLERNPNDLQWLREHLLAVIEFKRGEKNVEQVFSTQVKPAMNEKDPSDSNILGIIYDAGRLYLFQRLNGKCVRYDEEKNQKKENSGLNDITLHLPDSYLFIPSFNELKNRINKPSGIDYSDRTIDDLEIITSISTTQVQEALAKILKALDKTSLVTERGYQILIQLIALKIFDERENKKNPRRKLKFYITKDESNFSDLSEPDVQNFVKRVQSIYEDAEKQYRQILDTRSIDFQDSHHVYVIATICQQFQNYSFIRSSASDLYQLVFYNFANRFKRDEAAQFLTPLPVINFIVEFVNPRNGESVFDPCCGIGDFLSLSFVNSQKKQPYLHLDDANIYGVDIDKGMIMLATLNMLLNGDGQAKLITSSGKGSIEYKFATTPPHNLVKLNPALHRNGNWDNWKDKTKLLKFDVILTNPPFGDDRAYRPQTPSEHEIIEMYETWFMARNLVDSEDAFSAKHSGQKKASKSKKQSTEGIDLGIVFLENAYRSLSENGRMGIVLSNSIASINKWKVIREWLLKRMRIVALFDLPSNIFAETGVNTTIIVAYKPPPNELNRLIEQNYSVFVRDIKNVGYEKRTSKRNVFFNPVYRIDEENFEIEIDKEGNPVLKEDFTQILADFRSWATYQEAKLQELFLGDI